MSEDAEGSAPFGAARRRQSAVESAMMQIRSGLVTARRTASGPVEPQDMQTPGPLGRQDRRVYRDAIMIRGLPDDVTTEEVRELVSGVTGADVEFDVTVLSQGVGGSQVPRALFSRMFALEKLQVLRKAIETAPPTLLRDAYTSLDYPAPTRADQLRRAFARGVGTAAVATSRSLAKLREELLQDADAVPSEKLMQNAFERLSSEEQLAVMRDDTSLIAAFCLLDENAQFQAIDKWLRETEEEHSALDYADGRFRLLRSSHKSTGAWRRGTAYVQFTAAQEDYAIGGWKRFCEVGQQVIDKLHGVQYANKDLRVYWLENYVHARGSPRFPEPGDALEEQTLNKVLTFVWTYRDELIPETIGEEFEVDAWKQSWQQVLLRQLRVGDQERWLFEFARAFPMDPAAGSRRDRWNMLLEGERPLPLRWLGETPGPRDSNLSQLERELCKEAEKIFGRAADVLDVSKDGTISRVELSDFFSASHAGDVIDDSGYRAAMPSKEPEVQMPYPGAAEKSRRDRIREHKRLRDTTMHMKTELRDAQNRACSMNLTEAQMFNFLRALMELPERKLSVKRGAGKPKRKKRSSAHVKPLVGAPVAKELGVSLSAEDCDSSSETSHEDTGSEGSVAQQEAVTVGGGSSHGQSIASKYRGSDRVSERLRKEVTDLVMKGDFARIEFGLSAKERESIRGGADDNAGRADTGTSLEASMAQQRNRYGQMIDKELLDAPGFIVSAEDKERLMAKAMEHDIRPGSESWKMIFGTMIDEHTFKQVYRKATGVNLEGTASHVWKHLSEKFGGMIPKERFLTHCRTAPAESLTSGIGGNYYIDFCKAQKESFEMQLNVWLFLFFCVSYTILIVSDRGLGPGYYQGQAIEQFTTQELGGDDGAWFPWTFADIDSPDEWWEFMENILQFEYPGGGTPGTHSSVELTNNILGGILVQQWRVAPTQCKGLQEQLDHKRQTACYGPADTSRVTDAASWTPPGPKYPPGSYGIRSTPTNWTEPHYATCNSTACEYEYIDRLHYIPSYIQPFLSRSARPVCMNNVSSTYSRTVVFGAFPWDSARVHVELLKWLLEEQLLVRVEIVETSATQGLQLLKDGVIDVLLEVWSVVRKAEIDAVVASGKVVNAGNIGISGRSGMYMNTPAVDQCFSCQRWDSLLLPQNARLFSCNCGSTHSRADCTSFTCDHNCSLCTGASGGWCGGCPASPACNTSQPCDISKAAIWDVHPRAGIANLGPETFRSNVLGLKERAEMMYTETTDALVQKVYSASTSLDPKAILFFFSEPDPLISATKSSRVQLPTYAEADCPFPDPIVNDPQLRTTFDCMQPENPLVKLVHADLERNHPDVAQLVAEYFLTKDDLDGMLSQILVRRSGHQDVACDWLKENREKWDGWVRRSPLQKAQERLRQYYPACFPAWAGVNDEHSFSANARFLQPSRADLPSGRKEVRTVEGSSFTVPTREEWEELAEQASVRGNITAERLYKKSLPWIFQGCSQFLALRGGIVATPWDISSYYGCSGYKMVFPVSWTREHAEEQRAEMRNNNWLDVATRALLVEVFTYNQNSNLIFRSRYLAEISMAGGWLKNTQRTAFRLWQWERQELAVFVTHVTLTLGFTTYFLCVTVQHLHENWMHHVETQRMWRASAGHNLWLPWRYGLKKLIDMVYICADPGHLIDLANYALLYTVWTLRFTLMVRGLSQDNILCTDVYPEDMRDIADSAQLLQVLDGTSVILVFLRFLFFMQIIPSMHEIIQTVLRAGKNILYLLVAFCIIMAGFSLAGFVVFGNLLRSHDGVTNSFQTLLFVLLGAFDYEGINEQRPEFAFIFFFLFFILIICILFNLIIAVIGNAYGEVVDERVNVEGFIARVQHDPATVRWKPGGAVGLNVGEMGIVRELRHCWLLLLSNMIGRCPRCFCADIQRAHRLRLELMQNPRVFWSEYKKVMEDLASDDVVRVLRAHSKVKMLIQNTHTRPSAQSDVCAYAPGDYVYVRDGPDDRWRKGVVVTVEGGRPKVLPSGWAREVADDSSARSFFWEEVTFDQVQFVGRGYDETAASRRRRGSRASVEEGSPTPPPLIQDASGIPPVILTLLGPEADPNDLSTRRCLVRLVCDIAAPQGDGEIELSEGSVGVVLREFPIPTHSVAWQQHLIGEVAFAHPHKPRSTVRIVASRGHVEPLDMEIEEVTENQNGSGGLELLRVSDFLRGEIGASRCNNVGFFLIQLPANVLNMNVTLSWVRLLRHFNHWKQAAQHYSRFEVTSEDLIQDVWEKLGDSEESSKRMAELEKKCERQQVRIRQLEQACQGSFRMPDYAQVSGAMAPTPTPFVHSE
eukprot:TRINITY_DN6135_c0_g3_i1.p1 TRINITY_DN6135_c0_g3~~TRINITY_DN6135_c0_g3_i1.p1  ORF type:complete len:2338 (+),score=366.02 TRINITY_DN6135_c0_g3_i1:80-7015(+)